MDNPREKLVEIIQESECMCNDRECEACAYNRNHDCFARCTADDLISNGVTIQRWIPVTERLPKVGEFVLFSYSKNNRNPTLHANNTMAVGRYEQKMFLVEGCSVKVTHWMPLPEPPKGEPQCE